MHIFHLPEGLYKGEVLRNSLFIYLPEVVLVSCFFLFFFPQTEVFDADTTESLQTFVDRLCSCHAALWHPTPCTFLKITS